MQDQQLEDERMVHGALMKRGGGGGGPGGGRTYPQLYPDVRAEMGGIWVCFQPNVEQPGFPIWGMFKGPAGLYGCLEAFLPTMCFQ